MASTSKRFIGKLKSRNNEKSSHFTGWSKSFQLAVTQDEFQGFSAYSLYENLQEEMESFLETKNTTKGARIELTEQQWDVIQKTSICIGCRMKSIKNDSECSWMTLNEIRRLKPVMKNLLTWKEIFPILIRNQYTSKTSLRSDDSGLGEIESCGDDDDVICGVSQLLPRLQKHKNLTRLSINIEKISLKSTDLVDPYIVISVRDSDSVNLTPLQHTAVGQKREDFHIEFNCQVEIQKYIEKIPKGSHVFFELRHTQSGKTQTKCFSVLKRNEFQTSRGYLELYKGPTDYHLKNPRHLSNKKPLYLHVDIKLD